MPNIRHTILYSNEYFVACFIPLAAPVVFRGQDAHAVAIQHDLHPTEVTNPSNVTEVADSSSATLERISGGCWEGGCDWVLLIDLQLHGGVWGVCVWSYRLPPSLPPSPLPPSLLPPSPLPPSPFSLHSSLFPSLPHTLGSFSIGDNAPENMDTSSSLTMFARDLTSESRYLPDGEEEVLPFPTQMEDVAGNSEVCMH